MLSNDSTDWPALRASGEDDSGKTGRILARERFYRFWECAISSGQGRVIGSSCIVTFVCVLAYTTMSHKASLGQDFGWNHCPFLLLVRQWLPLKHGVPGARVKGAVSRNPDAISKERLSPYGRCPIWQKDQQEKLVGKKITDVTEPQ